MNSKRKIEINIVEVQTYKILIQINSIVVFRDADGTIPETDTERNVRHCAGFTFIYRCKKTVG